MAGEKSSNTISPSKKKALATSLGFTPKTDSNHSSTLLDLTGDDDNDPLPPPPPAPRPSAPAPRASTSTSTAAALDLAFAEVGLDLEIQLPSAAAHTFNSDVKHREAKKRVNVQHLLSSTSAGTYASKVAPTSPPTSASTSTMSHARRPKDPPKPIPITLSDPSLRNLPPAPTPPSPPPKPTRGRASGGYFQDQQAQLVAKAAPKAKREPKSLFGTALHSVHSQNGTSSSKVKAIQEIKSVKTGVRQDNPRHTLDPSSAPQPSTSTSTSTTSRKRPSSSTHSRLPHSDEDDDLDSAATTMEKLGEEKVKTMAAEKKKNDLTIKGRSGAKKDKQPVDLGVGPSTGGTGSGSGGKGKGKGKAKEKEKEKEKPPPDVVVISDDDDDSDTGDLEDDLPEDNIPGSYRPHENHQPYRPYDLHDRDRDRRDDNFNSNSHHSHSRDHQPPDQKKRKVEAKIQWHDEDDPIKGSDSDDELMLGNGNGKKSHASGSKGPIKPPDVKIPEGNTREKAKKFESASGSGSGSGNGGGSVIGKLGGRLPPGPIAPQNNKRPGDAPSTTDDLRFDNPHSSKKKSTATTNSKSTKLSPPQSEMIEVVIELYSYAQTFYPLDHANDRHTLVISAERQGSELLGHSMFTIRRAGKDGRPEEVFGLRADKILGVRFSRGLGEDIPFVLEFDIEEAGSEDRAIGTDLFKNHIYRPQPQSDFVLRTIIKTDNNRSAPDVLSKAHNVFKDLITLVKKRVDGSNAKELSDDAVNTRAEGYHKILRVQQKDRAENGVNPTKTREASRNSRQQQLSFPNSEKSPVASTSRAPPSTTFKAPKSKAPLPVEPTRTSNRIRKSQNRDPSPVPDAGDKARMEKVVLVWPWAGVKGAVSVTQRDLGRLAPDEFLNDTLIELGLKRIFVDLQARNPELANDVHMFNSFFYKKLSSGKGKDAAIDAYNSVRKWTAKFDFFGKRYIIVPINEHLHWYLTIIVNPAGGLGPPPKGSSPPPRRSGRTSQAADQSNIIDVEADDAEDDPESLKLALRFEEVVAAKEALGEDDNMAVDKSAGEELVSKGVEALSVKDREDGDIDELASDMELDSGDEQEVVEAVASSGAATTRSKDFVSETSSSEDGDEEASVAATLHPLPTPSKEATPAIAQSSDVAEAENEDDLPASPFPFPNVTPAILPSPATATAPFTVPSRVATPIVPSAIPPGELPPAPLAGPPPRLSTRDPTMPADPPSDVKPKNAIESKDDMHQDRWAEPVQIFTFDSLGSTHKPVIAKLKQYLEKEAKDKKGLDETSFQMASGRMAVVPGQKNFCDCGLYLLHYVEKFLNNPEEMIKILLAHPIKEAPEKSDTYKTNHREWDGDEAEKRRDVMRDEVDGLCQQYAIHKEKVDKAEAERKQKKKEEKEREQTNAAAKLAISREDEEKSARAASAGPLEREGSAVGASAREKRAKSAEKGKGKENEMQVDREDSPQKEKNFRVKGQEREKREKEKEREKEEREKEKREKDDAIVEEKPPSTKSAKGKEKADVIVLDNDIDNDQEVPLSTKAPSSRKRAGTPRTLPASAPSPSSSVEVHPANSPAKPSAPSANVELPERNSPSPSKKRPTPFIEIFTPSRSKRSNASSTDDPIAAKKPKHSRWDDNGKPSEDVGEASVSTGVKDIFDDPIDPHAGKLEKKKREEIVIDDDDPKAETTKPTSTASTRVAKSSKPESEGPKTITIDDD